MLPYAYDPGLVKVDDTYYAIWCQDAYGAAIGMAKTTDFKTFTRIENPFLPFNRNAVLFLRKAGGKFNTILQLKPHNLSGLICVKLRCRLCWALAQLHPPPCFTQIILGNLCEFLIKD